MDIISGVLLGLILGGSWGFVMSLMGYREGFCKVPWNLKQPPADWFMGLYPFLWVSLLIIFLLMLYK